MRRTDPSLGAKMAATSRYLRQSNLSDTLEPLADAVSTALANKILVRKALGDKGAWQLVMQKSPATSLPVSGAKPGQSSDSLKSIVKDLVAEVLSASLAARTEQGRRLRMAMIEQLASQERTGIGATGASQTSLGRAHRPDAQLTTADVATLLQVSRPYVAMLCDAGELGEVTRTQGGHRRVQKSAVEAYLAERAEAARGAVTPRRAGIDAGLYMQNDEQYVNRIREDQRAAAKTGSPSARPRAPRK